MKRATKKEAAAIAAKPIGITLHNDKTHQLFLIEGETPKELTFEEAKAWAAKQGGELPSRIDMIVLWKNARAQFKARWYWTAEEHESTGDYAWLQTFNYGTQACYVKGNWYLARAVRRVPI